MLLAESFYDVEVKRWLREHRLVKLHKRLGHALALPSLAAVFSGLPCISRPDPAVSSAV